MASEIFLINGFILSLFATWFIPVAIRDPKSGTYKGFRNKLVYFHFVFLLVFEFFLLHPNLGMSLMTIVRVLFCAGLPFAMALLFVSMTQKQMFGTEFRMKPNERIEE